MLRVNELMLHEILSILFNYILTFTLVIGLNELLKLRYPHDIDYHNDNYQYLVILSSLGVCDLIFTIFLWWRCIGCCWCSSTDMISFYHCHWIANIFKIMGFLMIVNHTFDTSRPMLQIQIFILFALGGMVASFVIHILFKKIYSSGICSLTDNVMRHEYEDIEALQSNEA